MSSTPPAAGASQASCCSRWSRMPSSMAGATRASTSISTSAPRATRCTSRSRTPARLKMVWARAGAGRVSAWRTSSAGSICTIPVATRSPWATAKTGWWPRSRWRANRAPGPDRRRRASGPPGHASAAGGAPRCRNRRRSGRRGAGPAGDRAYPAAGDLPRHRSGRRRWLRLAGGVGQAAGRGVRHGLCRACGRGLRRERGRLPAEARRSGAAGRIADARRAPARPWRGAGSHRPRRDCAAHAQAHAARPDRRDRGGARRRRFHACLRRRPAGADDLAHPGPFRDPAAVAAVPAARPLADRQSRPPAPGRDAVARDGAHPAAGHGRGVDPGPRRFGSPARRVGWRRLKARRNTALRDRKFDSSRPGCNDPRNKRRKSGMAVDWASSTVEAGGTKLHVKRAGQGRPLLVLHHETGTLGDLPFYDALAANHAVIVPHHPGYSRSERPDWMRSVRDIAVIYRGLLSELKVAKPALVGLGFGGWIAAEMATMAPADLSHLVLVGAMGIKPPVGDILDLAVTGYIDYARAAFHDQKAFDRVYSAEPSVDQLEMWDICREMSFRIAWKPYMYSQTLPHLLKTMRAPALIVWGDDDKVVPISAGKRYLESLPDAHLEIVRSCGHAVDMEQPEALAKLVINFIGRE